MKHSPLQKIEHENRLFALAANYTYSPQDGNNPAARFADGKGVCLTASVTEEHGFIFITIEAPVFGQLSMSRRIALHSLMYDMHEKSAPLVSLLHLRDNSLTARSRVAFCNGMTRDELRQYRHRLQEVAADARALRAAASAQLDLVFTFSEN